MSASPAVRSKHPRRSVTNSGKKSYRIDSDEDMSGGDDEASDSGTVALQTSRRENGVKRKRLSESDSEPPKPVVNGMSTPNGKANGKAKVVSESEDDAHDDAKASGSGSDDDDEEEYEIDCIRKSRYRKFRGKKILEYFIHWKGYDSGEDSWTGADQFDHDDPPVLDFYKKNPGAAGDRSAVSEPKAAKTSKVDKVEEVRDDSESGEVVPKPKAKGSQPARPLSDSEEDIVRPSGPANGKAVNGRAKVNGTTNGKSTAVDSDSETDIVALDSDPSPPAKKPLTLKATSGNRSSPRRSAANGNSSQLVKSSPVKGNGNLLNYFSIEKKKGKENVDSATPPTSSRRKESAEVKLLPKPVKEKPAPKPKDVKPAAKKEVKRKAKSDSGSDFQMEEDDEDAEDSEAEAADDAVQSDDLASVDDDEDDDVIVDVKPKKNGGWGKAKAPVKKGAPDVSGVLPLGQKLEVKQAIKNMSDDLPPMNDIESMFDHLVSRVPDITKLVDQLNGRKLRVATMCSGTESPLLALNMIAKAIKQQHGKTLAFDHVFSCEIEPFKQAYIERNFAPPVLFRDVTELGKKKAHTAYGSVVPVPGNVDILIAGTSCVDYSNLNNQQQEIDANGESGRTFRGMLQWVNKHQPPVVILENVCNAPWDKVVQYFDEIDYDAQHCRLDTKEFYIPHTRTRVYLFATPRKTSGKSHLAHKWEKTVKEMRRPWSAPFEAFLLHTDDQHIHRARLDLASAKEQKDGQSRKPTDWNRCESRHQRARQEEQLGILRPLTSWQEAGVCKGLDWTWNDWLLSQTERVLDLLEISTLRMAKDGIDSGFKACIWNVSQNVDRQTGSGRTALAPCLTPNMIPWVTNRGGPVTGREALALQGIPVRELLLTSESEDQLADLAGNAMTTTVVGASMLAALFIALDKFTPGQDAEADAAKIEEEIAVVDEDIATRIIGEEVLKEQELDLAKVATADLTEILDLAERSSRHCQCEGQSGTSEGIMHCGACGYRACKGCGGRPDHQYEACKNVRVEPADFEQRFKELLPMRVKIAGVQTDSLNAIRTLAEKKGKGKVDEKDWTLWTEAVIGGTDDAEFRFRYLKRGYTWTAVYEAPHAELDLVLQPGRPEWRLTIKAPATESVNSRLRNLLIHPVARLRFDTTGQDVLCGPWELCVPTRQTFEIQIAGEGELVPSWHASLGLQGEYGQTKRWSKLRVTVPEDASNALDRDLNGSYELLPKCGQAMNSLLRRLPEKGEEKSPDLFFFLDPTRCGEAEDDCYVFSTSTERLDFGTERAVVATLQSKWRESAKKEEKVRLDVHGGWVVCDAAHLTAVGGSDLAVVPSFSQNGTKRDSARFSVPSSAKAVSVSLDSDGCTHATALLSCSVPLDAGHSEAMWREGQWGEIDLLHQGNTTFANLAWITERLPSLDSLATWTSLAEVDASKGVCQRCAPRPPKIHWIKKEGKKNKNGGKTKSTIVAFEDKLEAGRYEHALKNRPAPFVVQLRLDDGTGKFRIGLNIVSLAHRALSRLPANDAKGHAKLSWKLTPGQVADVPRAPRLFVLPSNKRDPSHAQPKGFKLDLRKEQLRSLWWMLEQERATGKTHTFIEEEISEAALPALGWRAEGKAERPVMVRGGVIADQVGYGKTIISLALIAETKDIDAPSPAPKGLIDLKATLIVVPGHLSKQWPSEIERFTGKLFKVVVMQNMRDLQTKSIAELAKADIIVIASEILEADLYWQRFEYLSAQPEDWLNDKVGGRFFSDRLDTAMASLADQVEVLKTEGAEAASDKAKEAQEKAKKDAELKRDAHKSAEFGKRMKGQAYRDRYDAESSGPSKKKMKKADGSAAASRWDPDEESSEEEDEVEAVPVPRFRTAAGAESLGSSSVKKDFKLLTCPLLHMFRFRRVIADEFTYLEKKTLASLLRLSSSFKWILSGTPPVGDFASIRSIAAFMGIHLGVEDDGEGTAQSQKARAKEQTAAEKFHAFREVHSVSWHKRRDDLAQEFLNTFVRQNIAEIEDIPTVEHVHDIRLPAAECAVYLELEHHLQALEMQARKETKFKNVTMGDRNARLEEALADSLTAEEALLKRCCHFTLDLTDKKRDAKSAQEACEHIAGARSAQLKGCETDLYNSVNVAVGLNALIKKKGGWGKPEEDKHYFREWAEHSFDLTKHQGDAEAAERLIKVLERCGFESARIPAESADGKAAKTEKGEKVEDVKWRLREQTHLLRKLSKELVARVRSLRFFEVVRKIQRGGDQRRDTLESSECSHRPSTHPDTAMAVLSCCGHVACFECMSKAADNQACVATGKCHAAVRHTNIVKTSSLGIEGELSSGRYGAKLQKLVDLIHSIPRDQRVLVFLQWEDLTNKVSEALDRGNIKHVTLSGAVKTRANTLDKFQQSDSETARVLLLRMNDASAAGSNLTTANHAIFMGPLFTNTLYNYRATETQAIGRVRRYGQQRKVHVHRLLAVDTIDQTIFNARRSEERVKPDYVEIPQEEYKGKVVKRKSVVEVELVSPVKRKPQGAVVAANSSQEEPIEID